MTHNPIPPQLSLSLSDARAIAVAAQGLGGKQRNTDLLTTIERLGCVQIDPLRPVLRSHELVLLARGVPAENIQSIFTQQAGLFETWGHAHSLLALSMWPRLEWQRAHIRDKGLSGPAIDKKLAAEIAQRIADSGPATVAELGKLNGKGWERSSPIKTACEWLLSIGELVVVDRNDKWQRIYRTPQQADLPVYSRLDCDTSLKETVAIAIKALGIATEDHIRDYIRIPKTLAIQDHILSVGAVPTRVADSTAIWYLDTHYRDFSPHTVTEQSPTHDLDSITALSPFDSLIWTRGRQKALFGKTYLLEAYKPALKRTFGYYGLPLLLGDELIGRVAARNTQGTLSLENFEVDPGVPFDEAKEIVKRKLEKWTGLPGDSTWKDFTGK
ncbi:winged helix-turn-helix domain-containing protein [Corynebacterium sp. sy017]|uniref:DNA glycosylase AlkZ-like family protein n=1 Tax=unclassified Corynebacterium TaxID=2624378 RepID=UPI001185DFB2|nr:MULTISPECIES: crosslink repair DNA glycosylase YcaQ family protein [unclassified Corynebacterium]MBP3088137.1 winged helix-turn-helix domain-containing protein [Corynebacterium sp. sy017]TSD92653.1 winged helix-turn-helix domain-containing protein [Corynebacterium sp. SY003]